jgi:tyrosine-specific transport protein
MARQTSLAPSNSRRIRAKYGLLLLCSTLNFWAFAFTVPDRASCGVRLTPIQGGSPIPVYLSTFETPNTRQAISPHQLRATTQEDPEAEGKGSVLGASLLFAGTAIGAGMLALPAETSASGFVPSISSLFLCWGFTFVTSLVTLEASWTVRKDSDGAGFLSITKKTLGPIGEGVTGLLFWFLLTSIVVAYTSEGGQLVSELVNEQSGIALSPYIGSAIFVAFFASLDFLGTERVDLVNRVFVTGLILTFFGLLGIGLPQVDTSLLSRGDWVAVYPEVISIGILSFGAQNVVPTLLEYLGGDPTRTRQAVLIGSLIPLLMYSLWETVFLGIVPFDPSGAKMEVVGALGATGGNIVKQLVEVFSACAISSSMAGASVSLVDFFQDAIATLGDDNRATGDIDEKPAFGKRLLSSVLALGPPLGVACLYPDAFLQVLETAGLIGGVSLYGLLPALAVIQLRQDYTSSVDDMPGRLFGGTTALYLLSALSTALIIPDVVEIGQKLLT